MEPHEPKEKEVDISSLLLPREKYEEASKEYGPAPNTFEIEKENQSLFYFGANHSHDPKNKQYPILRDYWNRFLETTEGKNRIVLVEGSLRPLENDEEAAIKRGSEGSLVTLWAHQKNIITACPDLSRKKLWGELLPFSKEETWLHDFLVWLNAFKTYPDPKNFEKSFKKWAKYQKSLRLWEDLDPSLDHIKELYKKFLGKEFNENENPNNLINPNKTSTRINEIARMKSDLREVNIVSEVVRYWKEDKSVFIVFGNGHFIIQKPALEKLLG